MSTNKKINNTYGGLKKRYLTHREEWESLAGTLQQAIHSVWIHGAEGMPEVGLLQHEANQLLPSGQRLQAVQPAEQPHKLHKLLAIDVQQDLAMGTRRDQWSPSWSDMQTSIDFKLENCLQTIRLRGCDTCISFNILAPP